MTYLHDGQKEFFIGNFAKAFTNFLLVVRQDCCCAPAWYYISLILYKEKKLCLAISCIKKAIYLDSLNCEYAFQLGEFYRESLQYDLALEYYKRTISIDGKYYKAWHMRAIIYNTTGNNDLAIQAVDQAIKYDDQKSPEYTHLIKWYKILLNFSLGDLSFQDFDQRNKYNPNKIPCEVWQGQEIPGKTLLIKREGGFGDIITYIRFLHLISSTVNYVCQVPVELLSLFQTSFPNTKFVTEHVVTDYFIYICSLPIVLKWGRNFDSLPLTPYLKTKSITITKPLNTKKSIGLCWTGNANNENNKFRSSSLQELFNLSGPGIELYSLQLGIKSHDPVYIGKMGLMHDLSPLIHDFNDTAAIMQELDLIVSTDTSIVHLAGALGVPCILLDSYHSHYWLWLHERSDSPWYKSVKIYRQGKNESWGQVIERVKNDPLMEI